MRGAAGASNGGGGARQAASHPPAAASTAAASTAAASASAAARRAAVRVVGEFHIRKLVVYRLNMALGSYEEGRTFWEEDLPKNILRCFPLYDTAVYSGAGNEDGNGGNGNGSGSGRWYHMQDLVLRREALAAAVAVMGRDPSMRRAVFNRLLCITGIQFTLQARADMRRQATYLQKTPLHISDVVALGVVCKQLPVVARAEVRSVCQVSRSSHNYNITIYYKYSV